MRFRNPAWRIRPLSTAYRVAVSLLKKRRPHTGPVVAPFDGGRSRIYADLNTAFGLWLYRYCGCDPDLLFVGQVLRNGDVFIDGGAHAGMFTLVAARAVGPEGEVHAFEPHPVTFQMLQKNVTLNGFQNVVLHQEALGETDGETTFWAMDGDSAAWSHLGTADEGFDGTAVSVKLATVSTSLPRATWDRVKLIKLNLEGSELPALRGARELLEAVHPDILLEFVPDHMKRFGINAESVLHLLSDLGYRLLRPGKNWREWRPCSAAEPMNLAPERPNLLATTRIERLVEGGILVQIGERS